MAPPRGVLFLNPRAGSFSVDDEAELRRLAEEGGLRIERVTPRSDVGAIIRAALEQRLRTFVVAGGDGSIHHVAQALVGTEGILGIVPIGTVNHMARDLQIPLDWREALDVALSGQIRQIDTGRVNGIHFLNSVMVGLYPTIAQYRERFRSTHSKWRAYALATRLAMMQFRHVTLVVERDGRVDTLRTQLFIVAINSYDLTQTGLVALKTALDDGRLSIYSFGFMSRLQFVRAAAKFFRGKVEQVEGFQRIRTESLRIDAARPVLRVSIDGELHDLVPPLQINAVPASLLVRVVVAREPPGLEWKRTRGQIFPSTLIATNGGGTERGMPTIWSEQSSVTNPRSRPFLISPTTSSTSCSDLCRRKDLTPFRGR